ncbi:MAG: hypothetical protein RLO51_01585 [Thalassobaculum sp.]|uniref:hypothetical protein n=1 Tax=Thalassobaculum sp. TaxID=2022740 RepID=UPI0032EC4DA4
MMGRRGALLLLALAPALSGCPAASGGGYPMQVHGLTIERIDPDHRVLLADGLQIAGDARLAGALKGGGGTIRDVTVLERFPPVFVVTYDDGESRRYRSRRPRP